MGQRVSAGPGFHPESAGRKNVEQRDEAERSTFREIITKRKLKIPGRGSSLVPRVENHGGVEKNSRKTGSRGFDRQKRALFLPPSCEESLHREGNQSILPFPAFFQDLSGRSPAAQCVSFVARARARARLHLTNFMVKRHPAYDIDRDPRLRACISDRHRETGEKSRWRC